MAGQVNVLVVGEGGREFAIAKKPCRRVPMSSRCTARPATWGCRPSASSRWRLRKPTCGADQVCQGARGGLDLALKTAWSTGSWTRFAAAGLKAFGPNARAAQLEGSKDYALNFMNNYGVPTARHASYRDQTAALAEIDQFGFPLVIKENGLAGGKGL